MNHKVKIKTPEYSLVLCDLSAAEVRTSVNACKDEAMTKAYEEGKDLYSLIASKIYNMPYEECLEHYPEGTKIIFEGKEVICGNEKEFEVESNEREFSILSFRLVNTPKGYVEASSLKVGDILSTDEGELPILYKEERGDSIIIRV